MHAAVGKTENLFKYASHHMELKSDDYVKRIMQTYGYTS
jgi:hypothetical protein